VRRSGLSQTSKSISSRRAPHARCRSSNRQAQRQSRLRARGAQRSRQPDSALLSTQSENVTPQLRRENVTPGHRPCRCSGCCSWKALGVGREPRRCTPRRRIDDAGDTHGRARRRQVESAGCGASRLPAASAALNRDASLVQRPAVAHLGRHGTRKRVTPATVPPEPCRASPSWLKGAGTNLNRAKFRCASRPLLTAVSLRAASRRAIQKSCACGGPCTRGGNSKPPPAAAVTVPARRGRTSLPPSPRHLPPHSPLSAPVPAGAPTNSVRVKGAEGARLAGFAALGRDFAIRARDPLRAPKGVRSLRLESVR
jgi:hypothetical protein